MQNGPLSFKKCSYYEEPMQEVNVEWVNDPIVKINKHTLNLNKGGTQLFLYHMVIYSDLYENISPQTFLKEGLNHKTSTKWYGNSANLFPDLMEHFRPINIPKWIDFKVAFRVDLEVDERPYYRFPVFSDKVLVFNRDISSDLFAYIEDMYDGGNGRMIEGLPSKEDLTKNYWSSMNTLEDYLKNKPFNNPEVYIFEQVPAELIDYVE